MQQGVNDPKTFSVFCHSSIIFKIVQRYKPSQTVFVWLWLFLCIWKPRWTGMKGIPLKPAYRSRASWKSGLGTRWSYTVDSDACFMYWLFHLNKIDLWKLYVQIVVVTTAISTGCNTYATIATTSGVVMASVPIVTIKVGIWFFERRVVEMLFCPCPCDCCLEMLYLLR